MDPYGKNDAMPLVGPGPLAQPDAAASDARRTNHDRAPETRDGSIQPRFECSALPA